MEQNNHTNYNANEIQVLEGLEAVKRRPGMYIGSTDVRGLHHLVKELVDNAIDEAMGGYCTHIEVTIHPDNSVSVRDNGRGIPVGYHEKMHKSALEVALTVLHAGGKFGGSGYKVSGGLHGVGLSVVNALSRRLTAEVRRDGIIYRQEYVNGDPVTGVEQVGTYGDDTGSGTTITFLANDQIFDTLDYNYDTLRGRMRELAFLNKGVAITVTDQRTDPIQSKKYCYEGGIISFVEHLNKSKDVLHEDVMYFEGGKDDQARQQVASVEVAMQYNTDYNESVFTFANNINTAEGGTHLQGFRSALARSINDYARKYKLLKDNEANLSGDDVREGLTAIVSVKLVEPQFEGQTKQKLGNSEARGAVDSVVSKQLEIFLEQNPAVAKGDEMAGYLTDAKVKNIKAEKLLEEYDAVILACGASNPRDIKVTGRDAKGIYFAVDFLKTTTRSLLNSNFADGKYVSAKGKKVLVIGGGDTGNDCVGTSIRQGAVAVTQLEMMPKLPETRAANNPWPEWPRVLKTDYGQQEAIAKFGHDPRIYETTVKEIVKNKDGQVCAAKCVKLAWEKDPETGRMNMKEIPDSEYTIECDLILIAAGFLGTQKYVADAFGVKLNARTNVETAPGEHKTNVDKVYTCGDMHRGQSLVVWAIREGRDAAKEVDTFLNGYSND